MDAIELNAALYENHIKNRCNACCAGSRSAYMDLCGADLLLCNSVPGSKRHPRRSRSCSPRYILRAEWADPVDAGFPRQSLWHPHDRRLAAGQLTEDLRCYQSYVKDGEVNVRFWNMHIVHRHLYHRIPLGTA